MAQPCLSCHQLASFARFNPEELLVAIQAINAGERGHIPLPLKLTDQDIANITAYISEANAPTE
jgi:cytochrome c553